MKHALFAALIATILGVGFVATAVQTTYGNPDTVRGNYTTERPGIIP